MKGLVGLFLVGVIACGATWYVIKESNKETASLTLAYGHVDGEKIEIHVAVPVGMPGKDPPKLDKSFNPKWEEWVADHFVIIADNGDRVPMERIARSELLPDHKVGGAPEFFLKGKLKVGTNYKFDYVPRSYESSRKFRLAFTAPSSQSPLKREIFEEVTERAS